LTAEKRPQEKGQLQESPKPIDAVVLKILGSIGELPQSVYCPAEDSFLMIEAISSLPFEGKGVLDLGTGSGILGLFCALRGANVTVADIDEDAIHHAVRAAELAQVKVKPAVSDLFSNIRERFDSVLFNPPYLPSAAISDRAVDGGSAGTILIKRFLQDLPSHLKREGVAFLLVSNVNRPDTLVQHHPKLNFAVVAKRALFFEELMVLRLRLREDFAA
jgi:release factor glutamine methyltransferase